MKNIAWICRPFWKYGKIYIILSVCILGLYSPIDDIIYVRFPEIIIDLLSAKKSFAYIGAVAGIICGISWECIPWDLRPHLQEAVRYAS